MTRIETIGAATLHQGDCLQVMQGLPGGSVDLVLVDPPFSSGTRREAAKGVRKSMNRGTDDAAWFGSDSLTTNGFVFLLRSCALEWHRLLKTGGHILCFIDWRMEAALADAIESADLRRAGLLVWDKTYFGMGSCFRNQHELILHFTKGVGSPPLRRDVGNVLQAKPIRNGRHPTEKPDDLLGTLIEVACPEGGTVLDSFFGSGSTGIAAIKRHRSFVGIERETPYFEMAAQLIRDLHPDTATRQSGPVQQDMLAALS
jgi:site-specific DNA-methyltransferase (adenine-specific)